MNTQTASRTHPLMIIAAIAVTLFSLAGIGAILGWIPTSTGQNTATGAASAPVTPLAKTPEQPKAIAAIEPEEKKPAPVAAQPKPRPVVKAAPATATPAPAQAKQEPPVQVAQAAPVKKICAECGVIDSVREIEKAGQASGAGAVGGAVVGGVLGHQVGGGRGRDAMTVLGAVGGAVAGHQIEKNMKKSKEYQITVRMEDGGTRTITQATQPGWRPGDKVKIVDGAIQSNG